MKRCIIFIVFLILKLTHTIDWSWWWITLPIWIVPSLIIISASILFIEQGLKGLKKLTTR